MSSLEQHIDRSRHHRQPRRIQDPWRDPEGTVANAAAEHRAAAMEDRTWYQRVGGVLYDVDDLPDRSDVEDEGWAR